MMSASKLPAALSKGLKQGSAAVVRSTSSSSSSTGLVGVTQQNSANTSSATAGFHRTAQRDYPLAEPLPLPANIDLNESTRFSPQRHRDMNSTILAAHTSQTTFDRMPIDITVDQSTAAADAHIGRYDCTGAVSLCASMQSNVPSPFGGMHNYTHLNMPGGQYGQGIRLVASDQQQAHPYTQLRREARANWAQYDQDARVGGPAENKGSDDFLASSSASSASASESFACDSSQKRRAGMLLSTPQMSALLAAINPSSAAGLNNRRSLRSLTWTNGMRHFATDATTTGASKTTAEKVAVKTEEKPAEPEQAVLTRGEKLKRAVKEYGSTVIVFHVGISLASLGTCYALVSSGLDIVAVLNAVGWGESALSARLEAGGGAVASTFVIAYAVHKCFAPVRISITLGATPFIVRYLRRRGILRTAAAAVPPATPPPSANQP